MPKERIYDGPNGIEVQWAKDGQLVCVVINEEIKAHTVEADGTIGEPYSEKLDAMWQTIDPAELDRLIDALQRAKRKAFTQD
ncbi:MAG: hypothetical protein LKJ18_01970 [Ancrocorticia sp.]|jgi:uncharacterized tellurite resistance protein B-like protein|nr:hypothetical protein [Ancrocorticia sp.]MCI1962906.1 hypothetical protein [Ancrocorticia sp.]MCI2001814.1 hypothetical protein [Ancrocorticia sp.]MCI2001867.1 hypothetical protein [Ancrocorticia sp.]